MKPTLSYLIVSPAYMARSSRRSWPRGVALTCSSVRSFGALLSHCTGDRQILRNANGFVGGRFPSALPVAPGSQDRCRAAQISLPLTVAMSQFWARVLCVTLLGRDRASEVKGSEADSETNVMWRDWGNLQRMGGCKLLAKAPVTRRVVVVVQDRVGHQYY
jgi:hypothetical protein